jgi:cytochrome P450
MNAGQPNARMASMTLRASEAPRASRPTAPGPRQWPLIGNPGAFVGALPFLERQWRTHGDIFNVRVGNLGMLVFASPDLMQHVLVTHRHNYLKGRTYDGLRALTGDSVLTLNSEPWKERRAMAQPAFHRQSLEKLVAIMAETGARSFDALARRVGAGHELDIHPEMVRVTLDVVIDTLFGRGTLDSGKISHRAFTEAMEFVSTSANGLQLPAWVPTPHNLKFQRALRELNGHVFRMIGAARERPSDGTLLAMLLEARDEQGQALSDQALRDEVITLVVAGHETTALTLTWFFVLLEHRPAVLARMRDEVDQVLGGREPSFADVPQLVYVRQVVDEVLRLRPPVPMIARDAAAEDELGGFHVAPGQSVVPFIWGVHRHPEYWPDPLRFDPERFTPAATKARHVGSYVPFSLGPRSCIGNSFALFESVILLAQLVSRFEFAIGDCSDIKPVAVGSTRPSKPVRVRLTPRRRA